jgi:hypothetical protein
MACRVYSRGLWNMYYSYKSLPLVQQGNGCFAPWVSGRTPVKAPAAQEIRERFIASRFGCHSRPLPAGIYRAGRSVTAAAATGLFVSSTEPTSAQTQPQKPTPPTRSFAHDNSRRTTQIIPPSGLASLQRDKG